MFHKSAYLSLPSFILSRRAKDEQRETRKRSVSKIAKERMEVAFASELKGVAKRKSRPTHRNKRNIKKGKSKTT